jgi:hypothetical protein
MDHGDEGAKLDLARNSVERHNFCDGPATARNNGTFAACGVSHELGKLRLGFSDIELLHRLDHLSVGATVNAPASTSLDRISDLGLSWTNRHAMFAVRLRQREAFQRTQSQP